MSNRRLFVKAASLGGLLALNSKAASQIATPKQTEGPFYPIYEQKDKDFDLTQFKGREGTAKGDIIFVEGQVLDLKGNPIENATVDLWQANAAGRYRHPHDDNTAPLDPNFQGWSIVPSSKDGSFKFKTIMPGAYPIGNKRLRPPHIHFKISKKGYQEITTQMYFPDNPLNKKDRILQRLSQNERNLLISKKTSEDTYRFIIYLDEL